MFLVLFILFGLQHQIQCNSEFKYPDNGTLLNWRKNELRLKNDGYEDGAGGAKSNAKSDAKGGGLGVPGKGALAQSAADAFRMNVDYNDERGEAKAPAPHRSFNHLPKERNALLSPIFSKRPKHRKHKHHERVSQAEPGSPAAAPARTPPQAGTTPSRVLRVDQPRGAAAELQPRKQQPSAAVAGPPLRGGLPPAASAYASDEVEEDREGALAVPDAHYLDMAKAVGGSLPSMRYRNRLCSRHVLIPEGPKYDSHGNVYLPAFSAKPPRGAGPARQYNVTRRPRLLLPKCCNCCKKSVLGCE